MKLINKKYFLALIIPALLIIVIAAFISSKSINAQDNRKNKSMQEKIVKSDSEWKEILTPEQYNVTRKRGTEAPFSGIYDDFWETGIYKCIGCSTELFRSDTKFDAGCGWPSFYEAVDKGNIEIKKDYSHGMIRDEVLCARCGAHLGHVFDDGPAPTGKRFCINSAALNFDKNKK